MLAVAAGEQPPTLRLYGWQPPALSLGYHQPFGEGIDPAECARRGFDIVRRPTGGRAILHAHELTYSVCVRPEHIRDGHSTMGSYRQISRGIVAGLQRLGAQVALGAEQQRPAGGGPAGLRAMCFAHTARCDLQANGRKVVGSAQVRREGGILQHGSIPLTLDLEAQAAVMPGQRVGLDAARVLAHSALSVTELVGREVSIEELSEAIVAGFAQELAVELVEGTLSDAELATAERLRAQKYASDEFTRRL